ncbi:bone morphogenetic protein 1-like isoform X1 [Centruroides sculpturatus]|uniref:bone morphogenetic protein 1-like isoform X1 n=1 Tax=Centruroides sculpturatus TaxID=218467 RepID=UPI000C6E55EB|nr:bone morphogenetic protein 1-like isoform X1 [Centruroides sculpturatus]
MLSIVKFAILLGLLLLCLHHTDAKKIRRDERTVVSGDIYVAPKAVQDTKDEVENYEQNIKRRSGRQARSLHTRSEEWKRTLAISDTNSLWEDGIVPFEISPNISESLRRTIRTAIRKWESVTCLRFVLADETIHEYSVYFENEGECGCCSYVGKYGRKQEITLMEDGCNLISTVLHEIGHAIGFHHEQMRPDREKYIKVLYEHIEEAYADQYEKLSEEDIDTLGFTYDFDSIMHYASDYFSSGGETMAIINNHTGMPLNEERHFLSRLDIAIANKLYSCPACLFNLRDKRGTIYFNTSMTDELYCEWFIKREEGEYIEFIVDYVNIPDNENCTKDYLDFLDGYSFSSAYLDSLCGNKTVEDFYITTSNYLFVSFEISDRANFAEFSFRYKVACGSEIEADEGLIKSPRNSADYPYSKDCIWIVTVPEDYRVALHFQTFNLGNNETDCNSTYVEIWDHAENASNLLHTFCGSEIPPDILSPRNSLEIKFVSEVWEEGIGFSASFVKEINECESVDNGGCSDLCVNTRGSYYCECRKGRRLFPDKHRCEEYSDKCGGILNVTEPTIITSPSFPNPYPRNIKCKWEVLNENFTISFLHMDFQETEDECIDKIKLSSTRKNRIIRANLCGDFQSLNVTQVSNFTVEFESDLLIQDTGFAILFEPL